MFKCKYDMIFLVAGLLLLGSCRKNGDPASRRSPAAGTRLELSLDSLYLYAEDTYLWNEQLPSYSSFNPRQYVASTGDKVCLQSSLQAITQLAVNPITQVSYEYRTGSSNPLYSYIADGNIITGAKASVGLDAKGDDLGFGLALVDGSAVYVSYVESGSPADEAGVERGMQVIAVNGSPVSMNSVVLKDVPASSSISLILQLEGGTRFSVALVRRKYTASPVMKSSILSAGNKTVGYVALARFSTLATGAHALEEAFAAFEGKGITNLIIDLRYNTGGYIETAEHVANLVAPASAEGGVMYREAYNTQMQSGKASILASIPYLDANGNRVYVNGRPATYADANYTLEGNTFRFSRKGNLSGIRSIVFIVSGLTASASELLVNCLSPYVDVKLVGSTTYGKPVGFFGLGVDLYTVYLAQFKLLNARGEGDYFSGLPVDFPATDDVAHDFGAEKETCIATALAYISGTGYRKVPGKPVQAVLLNKPGEGLFTGITEQRLRLK